MATSAAGTTLTFNPGGGAAPLGIVQSIRNGETGAELGITNISDTLCKLYEAGLSDFTLDVTVKGAGAASKGDTGEIALSWNDGGTEIDLSGVTWVVMSVTKSGEAGGQATVDYSFKPNAVAA
jgi:hypothetical protein